MLGLFVEIGGLFDLRFLLIGILLSYMYIYKRYPISKNCREQEAFTLGMGIPQPTRKGPRGDKTFLWSWGCQYLDLTQPVNSRRVPYLPLNFHPPRKQA